MSRKVLIKSEELAEVEIALKVVSELQARGHSKLIYDEQKNKFINEQWDDIADSTIKKAVKSYGLKLQELNASKTEEKLKKEGYVTSRKTQEDGKIKIIAKQRVYA